MSFIRYPVLQYAYVVDDIDVACHKWHELIGAGPFFVSRHHVSENHMYKECPSEADLSYAFGQAGYETVSTLVSAARVAYMDTRSAIGCFIELYENNTPLREAFATWKKAHEEWDGQTDVVREA